MKISSFLPSTSCFRDLKGWLWPRFSLLIAILLLLFWVQRSFSIATWEGEEASDRLIYYDVISYYSYLPAAFVQGDLSLSFLDEEPKFEDRLYWPHEMEDGTKVIKTTMGLSYLYAPFFLIGHGVTQLTSYEASGFSYPYQLAIGMSAIFYAFMGLMILRSLLRSYYGELVTSLTLVSIAVGTNLFYYVVDEGAMSHSYNFFLLTLFLYGVLRLLREPRPWKFFLLGVLGAVIFLVRPTNGVAVLFLPLLISVHDLSSLKERIRFLRSSAPSLLLALLGGFLALLPQFLYWKGVTGEWIFYSYREEGFFFGRPMLEELLFGYRSGWLVYTPIMIFSFLGFFLFRKQMRRKYLFPVLLVLAIKLYLMSTWWCWWFGGSFGCRPIIDLYGILAIPLAAFYHQVWQRGWILRGVSLALLAILIHMNFYQSWQYKVGRIHWDGMTKEAYWHVFLRDATPKEEMIERPDYDAVLQGEKNK